MAKQVKKMSQKELAETVMGKFWRRVHEIRVMREYVSRHFLVLRTTYLEMIIAHGRKAVDDALGPNFIILGNDAIDDSTAITKKKGSPVMSLSVEQAEDESVSNRAGAHSVYTVAEDEPRQKPRGRKRQKRGKRPEGTLSFTELRPQVLKAVQTLDKKPFIRTDVEKVLTAQGVKFVPGHIGLILLRNVSGVEKTGTRPREKNQRGLPFNVYKVVGPLALVIKKAAGGKTRGRKRRKFLPAEVKQAAGIS